MKKLMAGLAAGVVALASANVMAQTTSDSTTKSHQMKQGQTAQQDHQTLPVMGVVTNIDKKTNTLTIVVPASREVDISQFGQSLVTEEDTNLISLKAPIGKGAPLLRDGKSAKLNEIKEGDVVRTSFDPNAMSFNSVNAVSQQQIDKDIKSAQKELKRDIKTMDKSGNQMNE